MAWYTFNAGSFKPEAELYPPGFQKPKGMLRYSVPGMVVQTSTLAFLMQYSLSGLCIPKANGQLPIPGLNKNIKVISGN